MRLAWLSDIFFLLASECDLPLVQGSLPRIGLGLPLSAREIFTFVSSVMTTFRPFNAADMRCLASSVRFCPRLACEILRHVSGEGGRPFNVWAIFWRRSSECADLWVCVLVSEPLADTFLLSQHSS